MVLNPSLPDYIGGFCTPYDPFPGTMITFGRPWGGDSGAFTKKFSPKEFFSWLHRIKTYISTNLFIACPDAVYNAYDTLLLYREYSTLIKSIGFRIALVAQDGLKFDEFGVYSFYGEDLIHNREYVEWIDFHCLFIGGTTEYKDGLEVEKLIKYAQYKNRIVHVGRVNSGRRLRHFKALHVDTVDGTHIRFKPKQSIQEIMKWMEEN